MRRFLSSTAACLAGVLGVVGVGVAGDDAGVAHDRSPRGLTDRGGAGEAGEPWEPRIPGSRDIDNDLLRALAAGRFDLEVRWRYEYADVSGFDPSHAPTMRVRLGYTTEAFAGWTAAVQFEANLPADESLFNAAGTSNEPDKSVIADPRDEELNQIWLDYDARALDRPLPVSVRVGRQRIILDDARFIGNVGWRQLEQTYDAVRVRAQPIEGLSLDYSYLWEVHRVFGDDADRDFDSDSHLVNVSYAGLPLGKLTGFAYLLDLSNAGGATQSSQTYGARLTGEARLADTLDLEYFAAVAYQTDFGDNPTSYEAWYFAGEGKLVTEEGVSVGGGFERLGSDEGDVGFSTPLATLHKFNGFADAFLSTPAGGLRDAYGLVGVRLPDPLNGTAQLIGHYFTDSDSGEELGWEIDAVATHRFNRHLTGLVKAAHFEGEDRADITRLWAQLELVF